MKQSSPIPQKITCTTQDNIDILHGVSYELSQNIVIHKNVKQEVIITTKDKIKLVLNENKDSISSQKDWLAPFSILFAIIIALCTCDFKNKYGLSKDTWNALFIIFAHLSALWLMKSLYKLCKNWGKDTPEFIIEKLKT